MSGLQDGYDGSGRWPTALRAVLLLGGSLVAIVGFVAATASLVAGFGLGKSSALKVAVLLGGALLVAVFLALFARGGVTSWSRVLAGVGTAFSAAGLALFWTGLPAGWTGHLGQLPAVAIGAYVVGLLATFGAGLATESGDDEDDHRGGDAFGSVKSVVSTDDDADRSDGEP